MRSLFLACALCAAGIGAAAAVRQDAGPGRGRPSILHGGSSEGADSRGTPPNGPRDAEDTAAGHVVLRDDGSLAFARSSSVASAGEDPAGEAKRGRWVATDIAI
eukprot:364734-Chlamydomonas_euryale.AAC.6